VCVCVRWCSSSFGRPRARVWSGVWPASLLATDPSLSGKKSHHSRTNKSEPKLTSVLVCSRRSALVARVGLILMLIVILMECRVCRLVSPRTSAGPWQRAVGVCAARAVLSVSRLGCGLHRPQTSPCVQRCTTVSLSVHVTALAVSRAASSEVSVSKDCGSVPAASLSSALCIRSVFSFTRRFKVTLYTFYTRRVGD
jgi:hypothetical protein